MKNKRSESIRNRLLGPLLFLLILQAAVIAGMVLYGGVSIKLKNNEIHILNENTENRKLGLEKETVYNWGIMMNNPDFMATEIQQILERDGRKPKDIFQDYELNRKIVERTMEKSIDVLHLNNATGVFLILNGPAAQNSPEGMRAGFYVRNSNSEGYLKDNSSLLMERGLPSVAEKYGIPLDSFWELGFEETGESASFYHKPYNLAVENQARQSDAIKFAYLSPAFRLSPRDMPVITYSIPVILSDGTVVGVCGLEMTLSQMKSLLEKNQSKSGFEECWILGLRKKGTNTIVPVVSSGYLYNQYFNENQEIHYRDYSGEDISQLESPDGTKWYASIKTFDIYGSNSPFQEEEWVLAGVARQKDLLSFYHGIRRMLFSSILFPLLLSMLGTYVLGRIVTEPILGLSMQLRRKSVNRGLTLKRVHISEIDELTETIEQLNREVERASSKISSILEHANVLIGVFEYDDESDKVFCSRSLFDLLGWGEMQEPYCYLSIREFEASMAETFSGIKMRGNRIVRCLEGTEGTRWVEFILDESETGMMLGVCSDVTADIEEKEKLERERNFDLLTDLYNRRAFREQVREAMDLQKDPVAAVIMWDLDNLKFINDTYGHDEGDRYLVLFASCMKRLTKYGAIVSRYSGDEFVAFLGGADKEEIRGRVEAFMNHVRKAKLEVEGGYQFPIRVSGGLSWYPEDADSFDVLFSYADFAMYMVKHSVKGMVKEFDYNEYIRNSYMLAGSEEFNHMLDTGVVRFAFQPIATREGTIYGYELLMRPEFTNIKGVDEVLNLARTQAKLPQMEVVTWFSGMKAAAAEMEAGHLGKEEKLFINSIASVCLEEEDWLKLEAQYGDMLNRVVIEMTESEPASKDFMTRKLDMAKRWMAQTAIDDFGTGYNSEAILLRMKPDIVKVDMSIVREIHKDQNRQIILKSLLDFAKRNHIQVLAEGVETAEELKFLMDWGISLFQGYYIARPQMEIRPLDPYIAKKMKEFSGGMD